MRIYNVELDQTDEHWVSAETEAEAAALVCAANGLEGLDLEGGDSVREVSEAAAQRLIIVDDHNEWGGDRPLWDLFLEAPQDRASLLATSER